MIKLPEESSEEQHLALLGVLNSSVACFWLRQNLPKEGGVRIGRGIQPEAWTDRYKFNSTNVDDVPLPKTLPLEHARTLDSLGADLARRTSGGGSNGDNTDLGPCCDEGREEYASIQGQMIAQQEELDWEVYRLYGLVDADLTYVSDDLPCAGARRTGVRDRPRARRCSRGASTLHGSSGTALRRSRRSRRTGRMPTATLSSGGSRLIESNPVPPPAGEA